MTACKKRVTTAPLAGNCTDVAMKRYGPGDLDGKSCAWRGRRYWCTFDPNKDAWFCDESPVATVKLDGTPPAERPQ